MKFDDIGLQDHFSLRYMSVARISNEWQLARVMDPVFDPGLSFNTRVYRGVVLTCFYTSTE